MSATFEDENVKLSIFGQMGQQSSHDFLRFQAAMTVTSRESGLHASE